MAKKLQLKEPRILEYIDYDEHPIKPDEVRAKAILSGISHGTEMNIYRGTAPFHEKHFDEELRLFLPDKAGIAYLIYLGYEWVGEVIEVGANVTHLAVGDMVHMPLPHRETHTFVPENWPNRGRIHPLPAQTRPEDAILLALAGVALQTVHDARIKTGDRVAIFGMGAIGLLALQFARINGASWIDVIDPIAKRRQLAERYGANRSLDPLTQDVGYEIKNASHHRGADVAIEVSGHYAALHEAIRSVRKAGVVVAGGYYQGGGTALQLGEEWHHNRVTMRSSMAVWDCPHRDYPAWNRERIHATVIDLLQQGRLQTAGVISHRFAFADAQAAYQLIDQQAEETIKVVLTY